MTTNVERYDSAIFVRCPSELPQLVATAANATMTTCSSYVRAAVLAQLQRDGYRRTDALFASSETEKAA